jgi:hypothetical protein
MTARFGTVKKIAGLIAMAAVVSTVGVGLGAGTAQAKPKPNPGRPSSSTLDTFVDSFYGSTRKQQERNPLDFFSDLFTGETK